MKPKWRPRQVTSSPLPNDSVDGLFARIVDRLQMQIDAAGKIEAALDGCGNFGGELNVDHGAVVGSRHWSLAA